MTSEVLTIQDIFGLKPFDITKRLRIKKAGRPTPSLPNLKLEYKARGNTLIRKFNDENYSRWTWLCGCPTTNALYCFPCIIFEGEDAWTSTGFKNISNMKDRCDKHANSKAHQKNNQSLKLMGTVDIRKSMSSASQQGLIQHNNLVSKNRRILGHILRCILFCGELELPFRGNDESETSESPGVFLRLIHFRAELDPELQKHIEVSGGRGSATYLSSASQNELLDCCWRVYRAELVKELEQADFVALMADETTDVAQTTQLVIVFRFLVGAEIKERFWGLFNPTSTDANGICKVLLEEVKVALGEKSTEKIIGQTYDGAAVMRGQRNGVCVQFQSVHPNAHYVHCYAHQLNLILKKSIQSNKCSDRFFTQITALTNYFTRSPNKSKILQEYTTKRLPSSSTTRWNFQSRVVHTVKENYDSLVGCLKEIQESKEHNSINSTTLLHYLNLNSFKFWLNFYYDVLRHVSILFDQIQSSKLDISKLQRHVTNFELQMDVVLQKFKTYQVDNYSNSSEVEQVIESIKAEITQRLNFKGHMVALTLFKCENFLQYYEKFPKSISKTLQTTVSSYPFINAEKLKLELELLYSHREFQQAGDLNNLFKIITDSNLIEDFPESYRVMKILLTIPMTTVEPEREFSTLKRIKTDLRNRMGQSRLNALMAVSERKELFLRDNIKETIIDMFAKDKDRRLALTYRN